MKIWGKVFEFTSFEHHDLFPDVSQHLSEHDERSNFFSFWTSAKAIHVVHMQETANDKFLFLNDFHKEENE